MTPLASESDLLAAALEISGGKTPLTAIEREAVAGIAPSTSARLAKELTAAIRAGHDPLGDALCSIRSADERRSMGLVLTPSAIIDAMLNRALDDAVRSGTFDHVVDPGAGTGRFLLATATRFPEARLVAVEIDPVCSILLRANLAALRMDDRATVLVGDYRKVPMALPAGRALFIGNPPYVRHHDLGDNWKEWYVASAADLGYRRASQLAGLHLHFFVRTGYIARPGDLALFVTSSEWMDTAYGKALRGLLCGSLGGVSVHVVDARSKPFPGVLTTAAVTVFRPHTRSQSIRLRHVKNVADLGRLGGGSGSPAAFLAQAPRWPLAKPSAPHVARSVGTRVGDFFRVSRGQVTGSNRVWIAGEHAPLVPRRFQVPCVTAAKEIFDAFEAGGRLTDDVHLWRVIDLPRDLRALAVRDQSLVQEFLEWARRMDADKTYIARHRKPWWAVRLPGPAPIICTYMARRPPAFVRNEIGARLLNIAHGLFPRVALSPIELQEIGEALNRNARLQDGRVYAGGLTKFEPGMIEQLVIDWAPHKQNPIAAAAA